MKALKFVLTWVRRLPVLFTAVFATLMVVYLAIVTKLVELENTTTVANALLSFIGVPARVKDQPIVQIATDGVVVFLILGGGALCIYNFSAWLYRRWRPRPTSVPVVVTAAVPGAGHALDKFQRIGLVLAGGGAKGAYQAGAMRAIYEFLEDNNALDRVMMVSGTSIGSWNAMFWLAGLVKPPSAGGRSAHEEWWRAINLTRTVEFDTYWPLHRNHFVKATPWQETFEDIFIRNDAVKGGLARLFTDANAMHFYFTRSNVARGMLEFSTNNAALASQKTSSGKPLAHKGSYDVLGGDIDQALIGMREAVFTSMDLPPLFPYMYREHGAGHFYEDGGVVDNLPMSFATQFEACDLVFILPLNASFEEPVDQTSVVHRLFRVMDVRQGVLERNSMKLAYLYNELAALRAAVKPETVGAPVPAAVDLVAQPDASLATRALARKHDPVSVFAICPRQPLGIDTSEFWKPREAAEAFELMYSATQTQLAERFEESTDPKWLRMTLVAPQGERTFVDEF